MKSFIRQRLGEQLTNTEATAEEQRNQDHQDRT
jgi:hypothetical protein